MLLSALDDEGDANDDDTEAEPLKPLPFILVAMGAAERMPLASAAGLARSATGKCVGSALEAVSTAVEAAESLGAAAVIVVIVMSAAVL